jgi:hypothetical protein
MPGVTKSIASGIRVPTQLGLILEIVRVFAVHLVIQKTQGHSYAIHGLRRFHLAVRLKD